MAPNLGLALFIIKKKFFRLFVSSRERTARSSKFHVTSALLAGSGTCINLPEKQSSTNTILLFLPFHTFPFSQSLPVGPPHTHTRPLRPCRGIPAD